MDNHPVETPSWSEGSAVRQIKKKFTFIRGRYQLRKGSTLTDEDHLAVAYLTDVWDYKFKFRE